MTSTETKRAARSFAQLLAEARAARGAGRPFSPQERPVDARLQVVIDLFREGLPMPEIAERVGMCTSSIYKYIKRARDRGDWPKGLARTVGRPASVPLSLIIDLYRDGLTQEAIAFRLGTKRALINGMIARARKRGDWPAELMRGRGRRGRGEI